MLIIKFRVCEKNLGILRLPQMPLWGQNMGSTRSFTGDFRAFRPARPQAGTQYMLYLKAQKRHD